MKEFTKIKKVFQKIQVVKPPKHRLATFGSSVIDYTLITDVTEFPDRARLRTGQVTAEKPLIITAQSLKERFQGFGGEAQEYADWLTSHYGEALKGLQYQFRNEPGSSRIELTPPDQLTTEISKDFERNGEYRNALLRGPDKMWELSIMKFIVEETLSSFSNNLQELQERGFFEGEMKDIQRHHREIQHMFKLANENRSLIQPLGKKLKDYALFDQYQDEFFRLLNKRP